MIEALAKTPAAFTAPPAIRKAAQEFEAMFVSEMLGHMFEGVGTDPMFGGGKGEEIFRSLLVNEYGRKVAEGPGIGISGQIQRMMIEMQQQETGET
jgi:peptidoglycan hydrolase FlgJ